MEDDEGDKDEEDEEDEEEDGTNGAALGLSLKIGKKAEGAAGTKGRALGLRVEATTGRRLGGGEVRSMRSDEGDFLLSWVWR